MPIEIRELVIKASIDGATEGKKSSAGAAKGGQNQAALINLCVAKVMEKLKERSER